MKKITVVLSGVGAYGYCSVALMEMFHKHQIKPNLIVGCSGGALIAALWAKGANPQETLEIINKIYIANQQSIIDLSTSLFFFKNPIGNYKKDHALLKVAHLRKLYHSIFQDQLIEYLPVQTIFQTTDVDLGETHLLRSGSLADAVYASSAILPFYPSLQINGVWLADGVFSDYLPLKTLLDEKSEVIIATDSQIQATTQAKSFMKYYAEFVQKSLKIASRPRTSLVYDMHNDEIIIIPIKILNKKENVELELDDAADISARLDFARECVALKEMDILQAIGH